MLNIFIGLSVTLMFLGVSYGIGYIVDRAFNIKPFGSARTPGSEEYHFSTFLTGAIIGSISIALIFSMWAMGDAIMMSINQ